MDVEKSESALCLSILQVVKAVPRKSIPPCLYDVRINLAAIWLAMQCKVVALICATFAVYNAV
jgi:hypothetical protein